MQRGEWPADFAIILMELDADAVSSSLFEKEELV